MKVAIYCRLSAEDRDKLSVEDDSGSIQNQKAMLIKYASSNGWTIYDIYSDDDYAGTDRSRPEFNRLIEDASERKFDIVLCKSQSRFTRELELVEKYINGLFPRIGIRFVSLVDSADSESKGNKKARQINGLVNEWFLEELSENIRSVKTSQRLRGYHIGSFAPYGYMKDPAEKGHLIIDRGVWDKVQALIAQKATPGQKQPEGVFARKVRCIHCGSRMHAVKNGKKRGFKCDRHTLSHDSCIGAYISLPKLERIVAAELYVLSLELLDEEALEDGINPFPELDDMKKTIEDDIRSLEHEIDSSQTAIRSLYMSKIRGGIGEQEYIDQAIRISEEKTFMENKVAELKEQIAEIEQTIAIYHNRKLLVRQYVDTRTLTKEMVSVLVDHILVGRRDPVTKETPIEIHWNF